jgi:hypothetical protein
MPAEGGESVRSSVLEQSTDVPDNPTDRTAETRYVKGLTRYMKIQKPGRALGLTRTLFCF